VEDNPSLDTFTQVPKMHQTKQLWLCLKNIRMHWTVKSLSDCSKVNQFHIAHVVQAYIVTQACIDFIVIIIVLNCTAKR